MLIESSLEPLEIEYQEARRPVSNRNKIQTQPV